MTTHAEPVDRTSAGMLPPPAVQALLRQSVTVYRQPVLPAAGVGSPAKVLSGNLQIAA
jgi:hypothetical protein